MHTFKKEKNIAHDDNIYQSAKFHNKMTYGSKDTFRNISYLMPKPIKMSQILKLIECLEIYKIKYHKNT